MEEKEMRHVPPGLLALRLCSTPKRGTSVGVDPAFLSTCCYVRVERLARLEQVGYDQVALPIVHGACALGTQ